MKVIFALLCIALVSAKYYEDKETIDALDFLNGFFDSLNVKNEFVSIATCVKNSPELVAEYAKILEIIKKFDFSKINELIQAVVNAYTKTITYVKGCKGALEEIKKVIQVLDNLDIMGFLLNIVLNINLFITYVNEVISAVNAYDAGKGVGRIIYKAFFEGKLVFTVQFNIEDFIALIENFLNVATNKTFEGNITNCLKCFPDVHRDFKAAIELLKQISLKDLHLLIQALVKLFDVVKRILTAIEPCATFPLIISQMITLILSRNIMDIFKKITKDIGAFLLILTNLFGNITDVDYPEAGKTLGKLFLFLFTA